MRPSLVACAFVLCGCVPSAEEEPASRQSAGDTASPVYVIRGQASEGGVPPWSAVLLGRRLLLDSPTSAGWYALPVPDAQRTPDGRVFEAEGLMLAVEVGRCPLPGYRSALPDQVRLEWDGGRFEGCGGLRPPAEEMGGTVWELVRIGDDPAPVSRSPAATLVFGIHGALGGTLACNDGGISTTWTADSFILRGGGFEQTAMGCSQPRAEAFGTRFWTGMLGAKSWRREGDRLFVTLADQSEAELRLLL
jgi:heat shock protein HslJ